MLHPPSPPPLIELLLLLLLLLVLSIHGALGLGSMSTLAASYDGLGGALLCGIVAGPLQGILCWNSSDGSVSQVSPLQLSFAGVAGGRGFFCALRRDTARPLCWNHSSLASPKRLDDDAFSDIVAGDSHVCALSAGGGGRVACWRGAPPPPEQGNSSTVVPFSHLASGSDFVCGLRSSDGTAVCWGNPDVVPPNVSFQSLQAGSSHACGLTYTFNVQCWGDNSHHQLAAPLGKQFLSLALGRRHSCGIEAFSRNVLCWGGSSSGYGYPPSWSSLTFSTIVAGDDFTCGILFNNLSVFCWAASSSSSSLPSSSPAVTSMIGSTFIPPLYRIIPSACTSLPCPDTSFRSRHLCSDPEASVCTQCRIGCQGLSLQTQLCAAEHDIACSSSSSQSTIAPPPNIEGGAPPPDATSTSIVVKSKRSRVGSLLLFAFGACGTACGLVSVAWCLWRKLCRRRQGGGGRSIAVGGGRVQSSILVAASSSKSMMRRQRSSTSSAGAAAGYRGNREGKAEAFSIAEMEEATMGFAEEMRIGAGSFGVVYRGTLSDGRAVAIKRGEKEAMSNNERRLKEKESAFQSELEFLSRLHHKHLVSLVGYCDEEDERMLVYEYMPNGTLHDHLHRRIQGGGGGAAPPLPWLMRIKIALEAARGVEYLHKYALPPIIHRDIKSSNILLDAHWNARVSDFGLSTHGPIEKSHLSLMAAGTLGYMDPEYYRHQHLTIKSDVYSFGVVLLELLTGERAIHKQSHGPVNIVDFTVPRIAAGDLASLLDRRAPPPAERERVALEMVAQLAIKCVRLDLKERPTMSEIVGVLEEAMAYGSSVSEQEAAAEDCASEAASEAMIGRGLSATFAEEMDGEDYGGGREGEEEMVSPAAMSVMVSPAAPEAEEV